MRGILYYQHFTTGELHATLATINAMFLRLIQSLGIEKEALWYTVKLGALLVVIMAAGKVIARELPDTAIGNSFADTLVVMIPVRRQPSPEPLYQELSSEAVIFSSGKEVLRKRNEFLTSGEKFFFADLEAMKVVYYENGQEITSSPLRAKGKEGSFFETPNGLYRVQSKERNHFSSIGHVWMPWSIHFYGNYFIHGWPYYPDGTPVADAFSGGCVRLGDEGAKKIYELASRNMPVLIYAGERSADAAVQTYFRKVDALGADRDPYVSAEAILAADFKTGAILYEKNKSEKYPIASITKLMTALVATETINRFKEIPVSAAALAEEGDSAGLLEGETFKSQDYLYPLILSSSNDVARLYERETWKFVDVMNQKAGAIGMRNTFFQDTSGLSPENISTAEDIFRMMQFIDTHKNPIFTISGVREIIMTSLNGKKKHHWINVNWPRDDPRFIGGKLGNTDSAKRAMAGVYKLKFSESEDRPIAIIVLRSDDHTSDVQRIIAHLEKHFVYGATFTKEKEASAIRPTQINTGAAVYEAVEEIKN